jgi:hypothetical protein
MKKGAPGAAFLMKQKELGPLRLLFLFCAFGDSIPAMARQPVMSEGSVMKLKFAKDVDGAVVLEDQIYERVAFEKFELTPRGSPIKVRNCKFVDCKVSPGTCVISPGVLLHKTRFHNFDCGDAMHLSSEATLNEVVVSGERPTALLIRPDEDFLFKTPSASGSFCLDISEYTGEVEAIGYGGSTVRLNPLLHVAVDLSLKKLLLSVKMPKSSLFWDFLLKLEVFDAECGVFSLPGPSDRYYSDTIREKSKLEKAGADFS